MRRHRVGKASGTGGEFGPVNGAWAGDVNRALRFWRGGCGGLPRLEEIVLSPNPMSLEKLYLPFPPPGGLLPRPPPDGLPVVLGALLGPLAI